MPIVFQSSDIVTSGVAIDGTSPSLSSQDVLLIGAGVNVISTWDSAMQLTLDELLIEVQGRVSGYYEGIGSNAASAVFNYVLKVDAGASVSGGYGTAVHLGSNHDTDHTGNRVTVENAGDISTVNDVQAVWLYFSERAVVHNTGTISAPSAYGGSVGVHFDDDTHSVLDNSGTISATYGPAVWAGFGETLDIANTGTISGASAINSSVATSETIRNPGIIEGTLNLSDTVGGLLANTGSILGDVHMNGGDDTYRGSGNIDGTLDAGAGDDQLTIRGHVTSVDGGDGTDRLDAWTDLDRVANVETVVLHGTAGLELRVQAGDTNVEGSRGGDTIGGGDGADSLHGRQGDDWLIGGQGDDTLKGGDGDDVLDGGAGRDVLRGGRGADSFVFADASQLDPVKAQSDHIRGFSHAADIIDLSDLVDGQLAWRGHHHFTASGAAELRAHFAGGNVMVDIDVDGDGSADGHIVVEHLASLHAGDFLL